MKNRSCLHNQIHVTINTNDFYFYRETPSSVIRKRAKKLAPLENYANAIYFCT